jgi:hypothetical protein
MTRSIALALLIALAAPGTASAAGASVAAEPSAAEADANRCVSQAHLFPDDEHKGKTAASVVNNCDAPIDMRICLMTEAKGWNCGMTHNVAPQTSWSWSAAHATGQVFVDARVNGSNRALNSPK